jgi:hypothetical protein
MAGAAVCAAVEAICPAPPIALLTSAFSDRQLALEMESPLVNPEH